MYALFNLPDSDEQKAVLVKHAKGNILNFLDFQLDDGYIPMMQGVIMNMLKPFLCQQISLISGFTCDFTWADDIMIGMDNDPASFGRTRFSTANIFLNGFMVRELDAMALILNRLRNSDRPGFRWFEECAQITFS